MSRLRRAIGDSSGASALEFAVIFPVLMLLILGMIEGGLLFQANLAVTHAAREGARLAAVQDDASWDPSLVVDRAAPLQVADGLTVARSFPDEDSVQVTVAYPYQWRVLPLSVAYGGGFSGAIQLESSAVMRKE